MRSFVVALSLAIATPALAAPPETWVPETTGKPAVKMQVKGYEGSSNGELTVEISNPGKAPARFDAQGLYFVPNGDPDDAQQRVGAVGPFRVVSEQSTKSVTEWTLPPGGSATIKMDVFCIDSHRRSPRTGDAFKLATTRMPKALTREISRESDEAAQKVGGYAAPEAKSSVQSEVWKARDKKWIKLEGEGKQELSK